MFSSPTDSRARCLVDSFSLPLCCLVPEFSSNSHAINEPLFDFTQVLGGFPLGRVRQRRLAITHWRRCACSCLIVGTIFTLQGRPALALSISMLGEFRYRRRQVHPCFNCSNREVCSECQFFQNRLSRSNAAGSTRRGRIWGISSSSKLEKMVR